MRKYIPLHTTTMSEEKKEKLARLRERSRTLSVRRKAIAESGLTPAEYDELQELESLTPEQLQEDYE
jgi:hypothetical protein